MCECASALKQIGFHPKWILNQYPWTEIVFVLAQIRPVRNSQKTNDIVPTRLRKSNEKRSFFTGQAARGNMLQTRQSVVWHPGARLTHICMLVSQPGLCVCVCVVLFWRMVWVSECVAGVQHTSCMAQCRCPHVYVCALASMTFLYCPIKCCHVGADTRVMWHAHMLPSLTKLTFRCHATRSMSCGAFIWHSERRFARIQQIASLRLWSLENSRRLEIANF